MKSPGYFIPLLLLLLAVPLQGGTLVLGTADSYAVPVEILRDPGGALTFADARESDAFTKTDVNAFGFITDAIWARFTLTVPPWNTMEWYLEIGYPLLNTIEVYTPDSDGNYSMKRYGNSLPFSARDIFHHNFLVRLAEKPGTYPYYIRFKSDSAMNIPMKVRSITNVISEIDTLKTLFGLFYGALLIILVYNLLLAIYMRDYTYLWYAIFISSLTMVSLELNGFGFQYLWPNIPLLNGIIPFTLFFTQFTMGVFTLLYINYRNLHAVFFRSIQGYIVVVIVLGLLSLFLPYHVSIIAGAGAYIPGIALITLGSVDLIRKKKREAIFYLVAFSMLLAGVVVTVLNRFGALPNNFLTLWGFQIGTVISIALFSLGLADRVNSLQRNLEEINLNLEEKVKERTKELSDANREIEAAMEEMEAINERLTQTNRDLEDVQQELRRDMNMAAYLQSSLLPKRPPESDTYDIALAFLPKSGVSGDFYDFYVEEGNLLGAGIFDVSGHGVASGLLTLMAKSTISAAFLEMKDRPLGEVVRAINDRLVEQIHGVDNYLTGVLLRFDGDRIEYVNCAHPDMLCRKFDIGKTGKILSTTGQRVGGPFLGIDHGVSAEETCYQSITFRIAQRDCIVLFTDSLFESTDSRGEAYQEARIIASLNNAPDASAQTILNHLVTDFYAFLANRDIHDDLTIMVIKKR
ncbi:MAG: SpoIIE family protein phosphatase [Spirochaetes bacterium]|nr:SpoIIE family protein phosphatase [Spirochaetota bacterium]